MKSPQHALLKEGLKALNLEMEADCFMEYLELLEKWNKAYNLTAVRDIQTMVPRHILDSLALTPWLEGNSLLDVGTGPGLPGIPLALAYPHLKITLLDSNGKKICFLQEVKRKLGIRNIDIVQSRVEKYFPPHPFDIITCRALAEVTQLITWTQHLISSRGMWLVMKGQEPEKELEKLHLLYTIKTYEVPYLEGKRCCLIIREHLQDM